MVLDIFSELKTSLLLFRYKHKSQVKSEAKNFKVLSFVKNIRKAFSFVQDMSEFILMVRLGKIQLKFISTIDYKTRTFQIEQEFTTYLLKNSIRQLSRILLGKLCGLIFSAKIS